MSKIIYGISRQENAFAIALKGDQIWRKTEIPGAFYEILSDDEEGAIRCNSEDGADRLNTLRESILKK